jgi:hypothetical protein
LFEDSIEQHINELIIKEIKIIIGTITIYLSYYSLVGRVVIDQLVGEVQEGLLCVLLCLEELLELSPVEGVALVVVQSVHDVPRDGLDDLLNDLLVGTLLQDVLALVLVSELVRYQLREGVQEHVVQLVLPDAASVVDIVEVELHLETVVEDIRIALLLRLLLLKP